GFARLEVIPYQRVLDPIHRLEQHGQPVAVLMDIVEILTTAQIFIEAIAATNLACQADRQLVLDHRHIHGTLERTEILVAKSAAHVPADFAAQARQLRGNYHGTTQRITTEQRALRAFQHLDVGNVVGGDIGAGAWQRDIRKIGHDSGHAFAQWNLGQAAHHDVVVGFAAFSAEAEARNHGVQILDLTHVALLEQIARQGGNGQRNGLYTLIAFPRGDEYFLNALRVHSRHRSDERGGAQCDF